MRESANFRWGIGPSQLRFRFNGPKANPLPRAFGKHINVGPIVRLARTKTTTWCCLATDLSQEILALIGRCQGLPQLG